MGTAGIIVLGVVVITVVSVFGDLISKVAQAKIKAKATDGSVPSSEICRLEDRLAVLEARIEERDEGVRKLQEELHFVSRMLEDKSSGSLPR